ncbi:hypothetical protein LUZ60_014669 [Juncus effusus]|nr:hypothetical protein LUZ60_014669 [Juncus effusus]
MALGKPLMLKDYLELEESSNVGFQCYPRLPVTTGPTMRNLLDVELRGGPRLVRSRSKSAMERISSVIKFRFSPIQEGFLSRSLSRKLKGSSFWKRRFGQGQQTGELIKFGEEMERISFSYPSPVVSSFRSWLEVDNGEFGFGFRAGPGFVSTESPALKEMISAAKQEEHQKVEERESMERRLDIEKEQLSPVSVMDFPYDEEDDDVASATTCSSPFQFRSITNNSDRSKLQILQKSKRFVEISNLDPINLEDQFTASESSTTYEEKPSDLIEQLGSVEIFQNLLEDFFTYGLFDETDKTELLNTARDWINNEGWIWELQGRRGEMEVMEMERIGKWRGFEEERMEISIDLGDLVFELLVDELVEEILE